MSDNTNTKRQIEALPGVHYRRATLSDCDNILALDPTFLSGMDYMHFRLAHYINDPNCVCGVMVTADDTVVSIILALLVLPWTIDSILSLKHKYFALSRENLKRDPPVLRHHTSSLSTALY